MEPMKKPLERVEAGIQKRIIGRLLMEGWLAKSTHGNEFQIGFPDIFAAHVSYGTRWIEVKQPKVGRLEDSQHHTFLEFTKRKVGVWILTGEDNWEYNKLFGPPNWHTFTSIMKSNRIGKPIEPWKDPRKQKDGPERQLQDAIKATLTAEGWYCLDTHGNIYQYGFPDLYCCHAKYGSRWIEVKNPKGYSFTPAQLKTFPLFQAYQVGVWVATRSDSAYLNDILFKPAQWWQHLDVMRS